MTTTQIRKEVKAKFYETVDISEFADSGIKAERDIYRVTVGKFYRGHLDSGTDVWKSPEFQRFIFAETAKIALKARRLAKGKRITRAILTDAAIRVMSETHKQCRARVERGKITGFPVPGPDGKPVRTMPGQGDICTGFLDTKTV